MTDRPSDPSSAEARLREAIMHMTDGLAVYDSEGRLEICNDSFRRINNYTEAETQPGVATYDGLGKLDEAQDSIEHKPLTFHERMAQLRRDGANVVIQHHGGRIYERHQSATPSGGMLSMLTDITDLRHALDAADQASRAKSEFLATMSHEIRTPITGILGLADILLDDDQFDDALSAVRRDKIASIKSAGQSLITILNDILDLSKIHSGKLDLEHTAFDLHALIAESLDIFYPTAHAKGIALGLQIEPDLPHYVAADPTRLRQVLVNLIGNAVKFTDDGSVTLIATAPEQSEATATCRFAVVDTGIGISAADQAGLFEDFAQVDASTARKYAGTGLGLAISRRLTHLMGGDIGVESAAGAGASFWFTLPVTRAAAPPAPDTHEAAGEGVQVSRVLKILLAEDNGLNQMIITTVLSRFGHEVVAVDDGRAAVAAVTDGGFDLVLMDIRMPEMDGPDATRAIRGSATPEADIPIIAVTADAILENRAQYTDAGMNACVTKPIDVPELLAAINEVLGEEVHALAP